MSSKEVALEVARFLDSDPARLLDGPDRAGLRKIAEAFFSACYEGMGQKPRLLEGTDLIELARGPLPGHFRRGDPLTEHVPEALAAILQHLEEDQVVPHAFELKRAVDEAGARFLSALKDDERALPRSAPTVVNRAPRLGRNEPCFCGSGKKFKKCCGKPASGS